MERVRQTRQAASYGRGRIDGGRASRCLSIVAAAALLLFGGCVDLTPPWNQGTGTDAEPGRDGTMAGGATEAGAVGGGGVSGDAIPSVDYPAQGGAGGSTSVPWTALDGSTAEASTGSLDSPLAETEAGSFGEAGGTIIDATTGAGGTTVDADVDAPLGGTGGVGRDASLDADAGTIAGTGGRGTGGRGSGGSGAGGRGTGGSGTGGAGTGGAPGTGGAGTGGSGTGGSGTGGAGTGGATSTGGAGVVSTSGLLIYYPCDETSGPTLADASGNGRNASLLAGTGGNSGGHSFGTGQVNNALRLVKASQGYADIGASTVPFSASMTVATWVYVNNSVAWQRVWDFGNDATTYMFLTTKSIITNHVHFGISTGSYASEEGIDGLAEVPVGGWHHVALVLSSGGPPFTGYLYVDGTQVGTSTSLTLSPASLGATTKNWIGKSQYFDMQPTPDPYLDGNIDDFRVYSRALSAAEIQVLAAMHSP